MARPGTRTPAHPKAASPRRCWRTSPSRRWMNTSAPSGTLAATAAGGQHTADAEVPRTRIIRYADDFLIMVCGARARADALWEEVTAVLALLGLRLSEAKTASAISTRGWTFSAFTSSGGARRPQRALRLHLSVEEGADLHHGQGAGDDEQGGQRALADLLASSTGRFGDGVTTSGSGRPQPRSTISTTSAGVE